MNAWRGLGGTPGTGTLNTASCGPAEFQGSAGLASYRPSVQAFRDPRPIALGRLPHAEAARNLVAEITAQCLAVHSGGRGIGKGRIDVIMRDIGLIMGGLLRAHFGNYIAEAPGDYGAALWLNASVRKYAFWGRVDMLEQAGFAGRVSAGRFINECGVPCGRATKLWATPNLIHVAAHHGVTADTIEQYWRMSDSVEGDTGRPAVAHRDLVLGPELNLETLEQERAFVAKLNAWVAKADIRGCRGPAFQRRFASSDTRLGGRLLALGDDNVQSISAQERATMTINGEPISEVGGVATQFSIFLNLVGEASEERFRGDLYAIDGFTHEVVRTFVEQSLLEGRILDRCTSTGTPSRPPSIECARTAVLRVYPSLADIKALLPDDLLFDPPKRGINWIASQFLIGLQSRAMIRALGYLMDQRIVALPLPESLLTSTENTQVALEALMTAFSDMLSAPPRFEVR